MKLLLFLQIILWSTTPTQKSNFKALVQEPHHSFSTTGIVVQTIQVPRGYYFDVKAVFYEDSSYLQKDSDLIHEKEHFNITELFARELRRLLAPYQGNATARDKQQIDHYIKRVIESCKYDQDKYERKTEYGLKTDEQEKWIIFIQEKLREYKNYERSVYNLNYLKELQ